MGCQNPQLAKQQHLKLRLYTVVPRFTSSLLVCPAGRCWTQREPKQGTAKASEFNEGPWLNEAGIKAFKQKVSNEQRAATTSQESPRASYEEILKKIISFFLATHQCLISSSLRQVLAHRHLYCWILDMIIQITCLQFKRKCLLLKLSFVCHLIFFVNFSSVSFLLVKMYCL